MSIRLIKQRINTHKITPSGCRDGKMLDGINNFDMRDAVDIFQVSL